VIQAKGLTKYYGTRPAIQGVTFDVRKGEILGLLGPNGAGKTTTLRIVTGLLPPSEGQVTVAGCDVTTQSLEARRHIGYLPENVALYTDMTVRSYLDFAASLRGFRGRAKEERIARAIDMAGLGSVRDTIIGKLSKGFRQRVGLAQALLHDPDVLVLDEPTVGLDPKQIIETRQLIRNLAGNHSVVLSTHILPEVTLTCQRVVIINEGRVVAEDAPENLTRRLQGSQRLHLQVRGPKSEVLARLKELPGLLQVREGPTPSEEITGFVMDCELGKDMRERVAELVVSSGWGLRELRSEAMTLEEVFLKLTTREEVPN